MDERNEASELEALQKRNELLESLSDVGVSLAGSFDIRAILETTHDAGSRLAKGAAVDVFYAGCDAINSKSMWCPSEPASAGLDDVTRERIATRLQASPDELPPELTNELEDRLCLPVTYQHERLGYLFVRSDESFDAETQRLLSILTLQAATALRNIHSTQERIHFERLSAIGRMIGSVVHDFRSPLTALRGYAGMLANLNLDDSERAAYGRYVIEECDRLNHMVNELLEFTRGGSFELEPVSVRVRPFVDALATRIRAHFGARGVRVDVEIDDSREMFIDKERMDRALWNVATNACQAMPEGGTLRIRVAASSDGDSIGVSIEDEGTGIPEAVRHRIFEPFFSYAKSEGIGLGMIIARKIAEEHGGTITVESEEGTGTTVRFELPLTVTRDRVEAAATKTAT